MTRFLKLTQHDGKGHPRVNMANIGWYVRRDGFDFTMMFLMTTDDEGSHEIRLKETPEEIDAAITRVLP